MRLPSLLLFALLGSSVLSFSNVMRAQVNTVNLFGTVLDPENLTGKGAKITVKNLENGSERRATSDSNGRHEIIGLPPGSYSMTVEAKDSQR
jgi:hypothetical protein